MRISLKGMKSFEGEDGLAFRATLLVDGKRIGEVSNSGTGGPDSYDFDITPNGKPVAGGFTEAMRTLRKKNEDVFREAIREDAKELGMYCAITRDDADGGWDIVIGELMNSAENGKAAKRWMKKNKPFMLATTPEFDPELSGNDTVFYNLRGDSFTYGIGAPAHIAAVAAKHPESRITAYDGETGDFIGVVHIGPQERAWAAKRGFTVLDTDAAIAEVSRRIAAYKAGLERQLAVTPA